MSMHMTDHVQSPQTLSYKYVLSERNYTTASITAVDLCGQRSEPTQLELTNATTINICASSVGSRESRSTVAIGAGSVGVTLTVIIIALSIVILIY